MTKTPPKQSEDAREPAPSFEEALARLEKIVETLDDGNISLAQSLALFKEGTQLAAVCRSLLSEAEQQVKEALKKAGGPDSFSLGQASSGGDGTQHLEDDPYAEDELPL
jgi:exodeoxyribonuclease VII small subunit